MAALQETGCCPRFDPVPWDGREVTWQDKLFVRDRVRSLFHVPINFGAVMKRNMKAIEAAGATVPDNLVLSDESSPWGADVYFAVTKDVPGAQMAALSGTYFCKVFEGPYSQAGRWAQELQATVKAQGKSADPIYHWYTTCPKCAKAYGKNYVVLMARTHE